MPTPTNESETSETEELWNDAYGIAWIGASNPRGVEHTIAWHLRGGVDPEHPCIRAMQGHLDFLNGESLGPSMDVLALVHQHHHDKE